MRTSLFTIFINTTQYSLAVGCMLEMILKKVNVQEGVMAKYYYAMSWEFNLNVVL